MRRTCKKMTADVGALVGQWCRNRPEWPTAKHMARDLNISVSTAEKVRAGKRPANRLFDDLVRRYGWEFLFYVMEPAAGAAPLASILADKIARAEDEIGTVKQRLHAMLKGAE